MQPLYMMKGMARHLLTLSDGREVLELVGYADGSFGIIRDGEHLGIWESQEEVDCLIALAILSGFSREENTQRGVPFRNGLDNQSLN
jgi:hypothetical protein